MEAFFLFLFFLIGLVSSLYSYFLLAFLVPLILYLSLYKKKKWKVLLYLFFTLFGILLLLFYPKGKEGSIEEFGIILYSKENYYLLTTMKGTYYIYEKNHDLGMFTIAKVKGIGEELSFSHYESGFDFKDFLKTKGVFRKINLTSRKILFDSPIKNTILKEYLLKYLDFDSRIIVSSLLFGDSTSSISHTSLNDLNLFTIVSVSGLHISFFLHLLNNLLTKHQRNKTKLFPILYETFFLFLTGFRYTIRRILLLEILKQIPLKNKKRLTYLERLSISAFILLCFEPYSLLSQSFYYSFPFLFYLAFKPKKKEKRKLSFPLLIFTFSLMTTWINKGGFNLFSPLSQILILPISHLLFLLSFGLFLLPQIAYLINPIVKAMFLILDGFNSLSFFVTTGSPPLYFVILFYLLYTLLPLLETYHYQRERKCLFFLLTMSVLLFSLPDPFKHFSFHVIDVDQGLSTLIREEDKNILIDTGGLTNKDLATECLIPYLHKKKIRKLDAVILTHADYDHCGSLESLKEHFPVQTILWQNDFLTKEENSISFSGLKIENLNDYHITKDENSQSGVYRFTIKNKTFLIMGDAPKEIEAKLMKDKKDKLSCDYLVIGHHGSNTSSSVEFLILTKAKEAIISCGENNKYGFPHKETIQNLQKAGIPYHRTDTERTIDILL